MNPHRIVLAALVLATGCNTGIVLTEGGTRVRHGQRADMPAGCRLVSDVGIGIPPDAAMPATEEELIILMRNKTHQQGGNFVILESSEQRDTNDDGEVFYRGRGTSYTCPDTPEAPEPGEEDTAGGEDTGGGDDTGSEESGGNSAEDDAILDDLLSD